MRLMERTKWTERQFNFDFPAGLMPAVLERLRGTSARISEMILALSDEELARRIDNAWSIKEHIGHLGDLEELHEGRIDDFLARKEILRAADMTNKKTYGANHNEKDIGDLLLDFYNKRSRFVFRLQQLDDETLNFRSLHPRLKIPARPVDLAFFTAEHDDHHLASMREILAFLGKSKF